MSNKTTKFLLLNILQIKRRRCDDSASNVTIILLSIVHIIMIIIIHNRHVVRVENGFTGGYNVHNNIIIYRLHAVDVDQLPAVIFFLT